MRWIYQREARVLSRFEASIAERAFATTVVNERERDAMKRLAPQARVEVVSNGVDLDALTPSEAPSAALDVVFCGVMNYAPNEEGAVWLATEVWPHVRSAVPGARLRLVGSDPTARVRALAASDVEVTGSVPDVRPFLWSAAVSAAPLHIARGLQNKVLEALAAGLPVVVTPVVHAGLPPETSSGCQIAGDVSQFADEIIGMLKLSPDARRSIAMSADLTSLSWPGKLAPMVDLLEEAARARRR
jgi:glycosyltransferase involved in cell wall biosynthesis